MLYALALITLLWLLLVHILNYRARRNGYDETANNIDDELTYW